jgi:hypothetical protein
MGKEAHPKEVESNLKETRVDTAAMVGSDHQSMNHHAVHPCGCGHCGCSDVDLVAAERSYRSLVEQ